MVFFIDIINSRYTQLFCFVINCGVISALCKKQWSLNENVGVVDRSCAWEVASSPKETEIVNAIEFSPAKILPLLSFLWILAYKKSPTLFPSLQSPHFLVIMKQFSTSEAMALFELSRKMFCSLEPMLRQGHVLGVSITGC